MLKSTVGSRDTVIFEHAKKGAVSLASNSRTRLRKAGLVRTKGEWLDWMILWVFSNLSNSMILYVVTLVFRVIQSSVQK